VSVRAIVQAGGTLFQGWTGLLSGLVGIVAGLVFPAIGGVMALGWVIPLRRGRR
jgi:hypothetical protein